MSDLNEAQKRGQNDAYTGKPPDNTSSWHPNTADAYNTAYRYQQEQQQKDK